MLARGEAQVEFATIIVICVLIISPRGQEQCSIHPGPWCLHRTWPGSDNRLLPTGFPLTPTFSTPLMGSKCHLSPLTIGWCNCPPEAGVALTWGSSAPRGHWRCVGHLWLSQWRGKVTPGIECLTPYSAQDSPPMENDWAPVPAVLKGISWCKPFRS